MATKKAQPLNANNTASTSVAVKKPSGSVVSIKEAIAAQVAALGDRIAPPSGNQIKLAPNQMTLPDGTKTAGPIELVVVDFTSRNMFYENDYDPNNIVPPDCFAIGNNPAKLVPSPNAPKPQADSCATCPMNAFGSKGSGKACKNERRLAVLPPDAEADTPLWMLNVAPTGIKGFDGYVASVARTFETPPFGVVTSVSLDDTKTYALPIFSDPQPNANMAVHFSRQAEARELLAAEPDLTQRAVKAPPQKVAGRGRVPVRR